jgi:DNA-binding Lrp family transcriptional regulator
MLNDTDRHMIALLRDNARMSITDLAKKMRVSRATVQSRLARLEEEGIISGFTIRLKPDTEKHRVRAWMGIAVDGNRAPTVLNALRGEPGVHTLHSTNGRWDIVAELRADNLELFDQVLGRIRRIEGIASTETSILLSTHKA